VRKYFADFRGNKSIFLPRRGDLLRVPRNLPLHLARRISTRYDTPRKREKETGRSISSIKTRHSTKIHSTRRSFLSPYLLCNTKCTLGIENLHSPFARHRYIDFSSRGTNIRGTRKPRFLHMLLSIHRLFGQSMGSWINIRGFFDADVLRIKTITSRGDVLM